MNYNKLVALLLQIDSNFANDVFDFEHRMDTAERTGNELPSSKSNAPRFFMADNVDSAENRAIWDLINPESTAVVVVSKSGSTAETAANFLFFWEKLRDTLGEASARERVVVVTDKEKGILRPFVEETGCKSLVLPEDVGGRFSVLSCVGLLSAWALGIDCKELLQGARELDARLSRSASVLENPAWVLAGLNLILIYHSYQRMHSNGFWL